MSQRACARRLRGGAAAALWWSAAALAQGQVFPDEPNSMFSPQGVLNIFLQACLRSGAQGEAAVDWALTQGFEPLDSLGGTGYELLQGQPGNVLRAPGSEDRVLLVVTHDQRCTLWAQRVSGPQLRLAVAEVMDRLGTGGARVTRDFERNIERAGAWRNQTQWRYRPARTNAEFGVSAVTTLATAPATQALNMAPWQASAPDPMTGR